MALPPDKEKKNAMVALIEQGVSSINRDTNILGRLWRIILYEEGLTAHQWQRLITKYQQRMIKLSSVKGSANLKGNLIRSLAEPKISWGTFMRGLSVLEYEKIGFKLELTKRGRTREVGVTLNIFDIKQDEE